MRVKELFVRIALAMCIMASAAVAGADEVALRNGDRLSGTVVKLDGGTLTVKSPYGEVGIPWADVTSLRVERALVVTRSDAGPATATIAPGDTEGQLVLTPGGPVGVGVIVGLAEPDSALVIDGGANAGLLAASGNTDVNSLRLDGDLSVRAGANRYALNATLNRASDRGTETARNLHGGARYDRFVTRRVFVNTDLDLTHDEFRDLDLRTATGAGLGWQVWDTPRAALSATGGFGYVRANHTTAPDDAYGAVREAVKLDVFALGKRVQMFHRHDGYFGVTGNDQLFIRTQNGARFALMGNLVTTAQVDLDYDHRPAPGRKSTDRTFAVTFGYRF